MATGTPRRDVTYEASCPSLTLEDCRGRSETLMSPLEHQRTLYESPLPPVLASGIATVEVYGPETTSVAHEAELRSQFPKTFGQRRLRLRLASAVEAAELVAANTALRVAVVLSGGQAPGGHSCIAGLYDYLKAQHRDSVLLGFLDGPAGIYEGRYCKLRGADLRAYRHQGGFDLLGSGRDKIETPEQFRATLAVCTALRLDGLVVIGGDDSITNAALLAEYFRAHESSIRVIGLPKTIDGDLKTDDVELSFGVSTATMTYAGLIGNLATDAVSAKKYWFFCKLMGRAASWITLECALLTHPNVVLLGEEVATCGHRLSDVVDQICASIVARAAAGRNYGIVLIPEGIIEFIPGAAGSDHQHQRGLADPDGAQGRP